MVRAEWTFCNNRSTTQQLISSIALLRVPQKLSLGRSARRYNYGRHFREVLATPCLDFKQIYQLIRGGQDLIQQLYPTTCWSSSSRGGAYPRNHRLAVLFQDFNSASWQSAKGGISNPCIISIQATDLTIVTLHFVQ